MTGHGGPVLTGHGKMRFASSPIIEQPACLGDARFTDGGLSITTATHLLSTCDNCPALDQCRADRDTFRWTNLEYWRKVSGVWAGEWWADGQPRRIPGRHLDSSVFQSQL